MTRSSCMRVANRMSLRFVANEREIVMVVAVMVVVVDGEPIHFAASIPIVTLREAFS